MSRFQLTLSILKPTALTNPIVTRTIENLIKDNNFEIIRRATITLNKALAEKFYEEHQGKFFYNRLQTYMCRYFIKKKTKKYNKIHIVYNQNEENNGNHCNF